MESLTALSVLAVPLVFAVAMWRSARSAGALPALLAAAAIVCVDAFGIVDLNLGAVQNIMLLLVAGLGWIVSRFSEHYLAGDPGQPRFFRWLNALLASVTLVIVADNLVVFWLAWVSISLSLHQLLLFYPERPRAALAAHKKFVFARIADAALLTAFVLFYWQYQTLSIDNLATIWRSGESLPVSMQIAACLIVLVAVLKCAQMPFHGWLIQVVEAPTPVSALLHAGVVNLGGFLLLRLSGLLELSGVASGLLLLVAGASLVLAALIAITRISIKVNLAWSTVAQMALMLVQISLGLYALAMLHLVAHSCYKAYAFLNSGSQVQQFVTASAAPGGGARFHTALFGTLVAFAGYLYLASQFELAISTPEWLLLALYSIGFGSLWRRRGWLLSLGMVVALVSLHLSLKTAIEFHLILPASSAPDWALIWTALVILALATGGWLMRFGRNSALRQTLSRHLYAGLYLDEWATRLTLAVWPVRLPKPFTLKPDTIVKETQP
ncbi:NADH-quinone oxidoreductase subunit L [Halopseudomonas sp.]|uniref:NADH-quinone oxidoreductase subunit L n=1 Tax=Halopseudomonas sp. TaxID=2901191 RepID=UPI001A4A3D27|nr:NADH-quinone oxidoreductase subunit L [Pseudomonas sp.]|tara:strand:- start:2506 stop:3996 length:1491 start_codon:yes stop_codon:yes gene_type:complete